MPTGSALYRASDPDWWITGEVQMLRELVYETNVLQWMRTADARRPEHLQQYRPTRMPLTAADVAAEKAKRAPKYTAVPIDEMADLLGWPRPVPKEA